MPEKVLLFRRTDAKGQFHEGVARPEQRMDLYNRGSLLLKAAEIDQACEHVALDRHKAEGCVVGIHDHDARSQRNTTGEAQIE